MTLYDADFVSWTRQQAALLRSMPADHGLDIGNLVDEVEGLGRSAVAELSAAIRRVLVGLIDLSINPGTVSQEDIYSTQSDAIMRADNGVWKYVDLDSVWHLAARSMTGLPEHCPLSIEQVISEDFDVAKALAVIRS
jgi:hypothetical protein